MPIDFSLVSKVLEEDYGPAIRQMARDLVRGTPLLPSTFSPEAQDRLLAYIDTAPLSELAGCLPDPPEDDW